MDNSGGVCKVGDYNFLPACLAPGRDIRLSLRLNYCQLIILFRLTIIVSG